MSTCGTPADGRAAARAGRHHELKRIYAGQLELPEAIAQGAVMLELAAEKPRRCSASSAVPQPAPLAASFILKLASAQSSWVLTGYMGSRARAPVFTLARTWSGLRD